MIAALALVAAQLAVADSALASAATNSPNVSRSALVVLLAPSATESDADERELQSIPGLSVGLFSTAQGGYTPARMLRDIDSVARLADAHRPPPAALTVTNLPAAAAGRGRLLALVRTRRPGELVLILERASSPTAHELRWCAVAGLGAGETGKDGIGPARPSAAQLGAAQLGAARPSAARPSSARPSAAQLGAAQLGGVGGGETLTSQTTEQHGIVAAVDVVPTLLDHLGLPAGTATSGRAIRLDGRLDGAGLRSLKARLEVVYPRRLPALACLLAAWGLLLLAARGRRAWAWRCGALAILWSPVTLLLPAAIEPSAATEYALIVASSFALATLTDALIPWPRAPILPAATAVLAISVDALAGTQLLIRSLLGPNPAYGGRFYGIGNELKSGLAVLVLAAAASALYPAVRSRRAAATMGGAGALLAVVEGAARIGAGVGGVILVCAGTAVAAVMLLPGALTRKRVLAVLAAPPIGLLALAAIDLATAHGAGHFSGSVLDARSASDIQDLVVRRYRAAWHELGNGLMPLASAAALLLAGAGIRHRERLLRPVHRDPAWLAALAGGLAAGLTGALVEDSGPVLLVVAVFALGCVLAYLWGRPLTPLTPRSPRTPRAARSRALTQSAGRAR